MTDVDTGQTGWGSDDRCTQVRPDGAVMTDVDTCQTGWGSDDRCRHRSDWMGQ